MQAVIQPACLCIEHDLSARCSEINILPIDLWPFQVFFCKYNDPLYVKMEKLEIMIKLANERNIDQVRL